jgi:hypothetical protein
LGNFVREEGNFMMSIESTYAPHSTLLTVNSDDNCSDNQLEEPEKTEMDQWDDMEDVIASGKASASAGFASGVNPKHLSEGKNSIFVNLDGMNGVNIENTLPPFQPTGSPKESDWTSKWRRQRNVPMGVEGQWKGCSYEICQASHSLRAKRRSK